MQKGNGTLVILTLVVLGFLGFSYFNSQKNVMPADSSMEEGVADGGAMNDEDLMTMILEDENTLVATLEDVSGGSSSGTAYLLRKDSLLYHYVEVDLPDPAPGLVYEGWLVNKVPTLEFFSTGVMKKTGDIYVLTYTSENEYPGFNEVVITLETKVDETPEKHIVEGLLQ